MGPVGQRVASFVPGILVEHLAIQPSPPDAFSSVDLEGTTLGIDVVGFTSLTERIAGREPDAVEDVQTLLNALFAPLLLAIDRRGGHVVRFAGDSITAVWSGRGPDIVDDVARCGLELVSTVSRSTASNG